MYTWDALKENAKKQRYCWQLQNHVWIQNFCRRNWKKQRRRLNSTRYPLHHALTTIISKKTNWNPWENYQKYVLKLLWNAYTWHVLEDLIFYGQSTNLHDRSQNGPKACDKRLARLISYINHTCDYKQYCHVGNTAKQCRVGLFQDSEFAGGSWGLKIHFRVELCAFWKSIRLFQSVGCVRNRCRKEHKDAGEESRSKIRYTRTWFMGSDRDSSSPKHASEWSRTGRPVKISNVKEISWKDDDLNNVDVISSNLKSSRKEALLYIFEDNEAVIKMIMKGRSPTMRHVSRTHRVALDWLFDRINLEAKIQIQIHLYQNPTRRHADKGSTVLKRCRKEHKEDAGEVRVTAKPSLRSNDKFHTWWLETSFVFLEIVGNGKPTGSVLKETVVVSATIWISGKSSPLNPSPNSFMRQSELRLSERKHIEDPKSQR